ncbi:MAG TPA: phosphoribosylglycinamide formyltransferase [Mesotoga infera]|uniref:Phosphoribosylglycinamide formyltransferase n=1 Tax=Mesotoga infera TaxID=1236046 RepID=A0A7Z7LDS7_9BACT|nr:phosphoribosylglycinamide formyltransferase [Mesotoga infera]MBP8660163.1 phosphoribosylglycinamide formyltransferase [Mesotoga sp.]NLI06510.1 phosphoribosylglycinamide formyltransferase [Thermotogaceae bacterium]SSC12011.1 Phosphoribosylglycinamide formyltransferase [Mesotoga infera]HNS66276.1 phosphoribosylglycinamide formyltransferase [Mesotoga infera]HOI35145.1 phosphoribosylglycinamide formyltransferase [Mesotoga infera]
MPKRIAVLVSGNGSNLERLIELSVSGFIDGEISLVISSNEKAFALERAKRHSIPSHVVHYGGRSGGDYSDAILQIVEDCRIDLIVLAGFLKILSGNIIERFRNRIINLHPSLIPSFCGKGMYGEKVHRAVIESGVRITGATVHFVDGGTDTGPIILQESVPVFCDDSVESLSGRVAQVEHRLLPKAVSLFCENRLTVMGKRVLITGGFYEDSVVERL